MEGKFRRPRVHLQGIVEVLAGVGGRDADASARSQQRRGGEADHDQGHAALPAQPRRRCHLPRVEQHQRLHQHRQFISSPRDTNVTTAVHACATPRYTRRVQCTLAALLGNFSL